MYLLQFRRNYMSVVFNWLIIRNLRFLFNLSILKYLIQSTDIAPGFLHIKYCKLSCYLLNLQA